MDEVITQLMEVVQVSPELDSPALEIPDYYAGLRYLEEYEAHVASGWAKVSDGKDEMHIALHMILQNDLWLYARDDNGKQIWFKQEDYLRNLADRLRAPRSTIFAKRATMKMATVGLGYSVEEISQIGISPFSTMKGLVETDRDSGEILAIKGVDVPADRTPGEIAREAFDMLVVVKSDKEESLTPSDLRKAFAAHLGIKEPHITFYAVPTSEGGLSIGYDYKNGNDWKKSLLEDDEVPQPVQEKLFRLLHILSTN